MKVVILCGGNGLRIKGFFKDTPKPLISINKKPILQYIINGFSDYGITDFLLLVGKDEDKFIDFASQFRINNIKVQVIQTGLETPTGGRIKKAEHLLVDQEHFFLAYGDGIANIDFKSLLQFHKQHLHIATLTAVKPQLPFGLLNIDNNSTVVSFEEKPFLEQYISGGFFVLNKRILDIMKENSDFENDILPVLSKQQQLKAYIHNGFWKNIDTYKDYLFLSNTDLNIFES